MGRGLEKVASSFEKRATTCTEHVMFKSSPGHKMTRRPELLQVVLLFVSRRHVFAIYNAKTVEAGKEVLSRIRV